jgi:hypothetical protein
MKQDVTLVEAVFVETSKRICKESTANSTDAAAYLESLLLIVRSSELACVLRNMPDKLTECCESVKSALANSSMDRQAESLLTVVQLLIGNIHV